MRRGEGVVIVTLQYSPNCKRCPYLERLVRRICEDLRIPFVVERIGSVGDPRKPLIRIPFVAQDTFRVEKAREIDPQGAVYLERLRELGFNPEREIPTPVLIIDVHKRGKFFDRIIIRGFDPSDREKVRSFIENLGSLLESLKEVVMSE